MIVLDSSFLIGYYNDRDAHHEKALATMVEIAAGQWGPALLAEYALVETLTVIAFRRGLPQAIAAWDALLGAREFEFVPCSDVLLDAFARFKAQRAPRLSLTDAAILVIAERRGARHVATFDEDFRRVAGVKVVPGSRR